MYEYTSRVRYSEIDRTGCMSLMGLVALLQDCGYLHAEDRGIGTEFAKREKHTWFLLTWNIQVYRMPKISEGYTVKTWLYAMKGAIAKRNYCLCGENGEILAKGDTQWVYMDTEAMCPARPPQGQFPPEDFAEAQEMEYFPRKIAVPTEAVAEEPVTVTAAEVDTNGHVNNFRFAQLAYRCAGEPEDCRGLQAEYVRQAYLGDRLTPLVLRKEGKVWITLRNEAGEDCATFVFQ